MPEQQIVATLSQQFEPASVLVSAFGEHRDSRCLDAHFYRTDADALFHLSEKLCSARRVIVPTPMDEACRASRSRTHPHPTSDAFIRSTM